MSPKDFSAASLLDTMTSDTAKRKGVGLTPVGLESPLAAEEVAAAPPADDRAVFDTADLPPTLMERLMNARREAQRLSGLLIEIEHDLNRSMGANMEADYFAAAKKVFPDAVEVWDEAGAKPMSQFAADFAAMQKVAQAATFRSTSEPVSQRAEQWNCPEHGAATTIDTVSPKGRHHRKCTQCKEFEK